MRRTLHALQTMVLIGIAAITTLGGAYVCAEDWPTYLRDNARSGITNETLGLPLHKTWVHVPRHAPEPAWPAPAKQDIWHELRELSPLVTYDRAFHVVVAGDAAYYASSADDQVYCLDARTGEIRWTFFAEGPVRLAPTIADSRVYFSSDDGCAYCVNAADGALLWKHCPAELDRRIPGNSRVISHAPARTGVLVDNGVAYFFAGLFPPDGVYRCALDAATGAVLHVSGDTDASPQGYLLATPKRLFVPTGRTAPVMFDRETLAPLGALPGPGGAYAILADDAVVSGPGLRSGNQLDYADPNTGENIASFPGIRMLVQGDIAYLQSKEEVSAMNRPRYLEVTRELNRQSAVLNEIVKQRRALTRDQAGERERLEAEIATQETVIAGIREQQEACYLWRKPMRDPYAMILAGDALFLGGENQVVALRAADGEQVWRGEVEGKVYGLSAANGRLFVSSHLGPIYCFTPARADKQVLRSDAPEALWPKDASSAMYAKTAEVILAKSGITQGYCLILGAGDGRLAHELAQRSALRIVCVERDAARAADARKRLNDAGLYGVRATVHHVESDTLPYTTYMANLVVSEDALGGAVPSWSAEEVWRVLRPYGGVMCIGRPNGAGDGLTAATLEAWANRGDVQDAGVDVDDGLWLTARRGAVPGAGEWTQLYADASHTACSNDQLRGPMAIQWFGDPGPRDMVDRHHRPMASLFKNGRLHITADDKVITVDAYNGFPLWETDVPGARRVGTMKNAGERLLTDDALYVAVDGECRVLDPATGAQLRAIAMPRIEETVNEWGYLNSMDGLLIGTGQISGASFDELALATVHMLEGDFRPVVVSRCLFAVDRHTGKKQWTWQRGAIMNSMITIAEGRVYFLESRNDRAMSESAQRGRTRVDHFCRENAWLVALDLKRGKKVWERPVELPFHHIAHLNGKDGVLLASGSYNDGDKVFYDLLAFDMATGADKWRTSFQAMNIRCTDFTETGGTHGEQWQHPVLIDDTIYARPFAFSLHTGEKLDYIAYRGGHGCGGLTGSKYYLYGRGNNPRMYPLDVESTEGIHLTRVSRPGCWLNIIPAGGIVMIPESSSGCTCAYPLQTSFALAPAALSGGVTRR